MSELLHKFATDDATIYSKLVVGNFLAPNTVTIQLDNKWIMKIDETGLLTINKEFVKPADEIAEEVLKLIDNAILPSFRTNSESSKNS